MRIAKKTIIVGPLKGGDKQEKGKRKKGLDSREKKPENKEKREIDLRARLFDQLSQRSSQL